MNAVLWNSLPKQLRQPSGVFGASICPSLGTAPDSSLLALSSHQFHSKPKTFLFENYFFLIILFENYFFLSSVLFAPTLVLSGPLTYL